MTSYRRYTRRSLLSLAGIAIGVYLIWLGVTWHNCHSVHWVRFHGDSVEKLGRSAPDQVQDWNENMSTLYYPIRSAKEAEVVYNLRVTRIEGLCDKLEHVGHNDGVKILCTSGPYQLAKPCLVYSFGVAQDFSFDEEIISRFGCDVFAFDPSTGLESHERSSNLHFFNLGLADRNRDNYRAPKTVYSHSPHPWKLRTLEWILVHYRHSDTIIDLLKLDIEGWEFGALSHALSSGVLHRVKQVVVELHIFGEERKQFVKKLALLVRLFDFGFRIVYQKKHYCPDECGEFCKSSYCNQADITLLNSRFGFSQYSDKVREKEFS